MKKAVLSILIVVAMLAVALIAQAQQPGKIYRIGMLVSGSVATHGHRIGAFRQGMRELGYVEGKNIVIEYRYGEGKRERFADLAAEIVSLKPDVIYVGSTAFTQAAKKATSVIPIVATAADLVGDGIVASLAHPGGNVTGSTGVSPDLSGKRLQLLNEAVPKVRRIAVVYHLNKSDEEEVKQTKVAAGAFGITIYALPVRATDELFKAFAAMNKENANALVIIQGSFNNSHINEIAELSLKYRLPAIGEAPDYTNNGVLMSYGPNLDDFWRRGAIFVDKILKGRRPADLPVEQPMKFDFVINLKSAKQIGVTIPPNVLVRADRVIR
jgi:putative ABC transport system substrate-binding protein